MNRKKRNHLRFLILGLVNSMLLIILVKYAILGNIPLILLAIIVLVLTIHELLGLGLASQVYEIKELKQK